MANFTAATAGGIYTNWLGSVPTIDADHAILASVHGEYLRAMRFDLSTAREAAETGSLEAWVHEYLQGPGCNLPFSDGLRLRQRSWRGPLLLPIDELLRTCGPEPTMRFRVSAESWAQKISEIVASFVTLDAFPPLIVEYSAGDFIVCDGSHRLGAFTAMGIRTCWVILWYPDEAERAHHEARLDSGRTGLTRTVSSWSGARRRAAHDGAIIRDQTRARQHALLR